MSASVIHNGSEILTKGSDVLFKGQLGGVKFFEDEDHAICVNSLNHTSDSDVFMLAFKVRFHDFVTNQTLLRLVNAQKSYILRFNGAVRRLRFDKIDSAIDRRGVYGNTVFNTSGNINYTIFVYKGNSAGTNWGFWVNKGSKENTPISGGDNPIMGTGFTCELASSRSTTFLSARMEVAYHAYFKRLLTTDEMHFIHDNEIKLPSTILTSDIEYLLLPRRSNGTLLIDKYSNNNFTLINLNTTKGNVNNAWRDWYFGTEK